MYHIAGAMPSGAIRPRIVHAGVNKALAKFAIESINVGGDAESCRVYCASTPIKRVPTASQLTTILATLPSWNGTSVDRAAASRSACSFCARTALWMASSLFLALA